MRAKLVVVGGDTKTPEVELQLPAILGRGREATLTLPHPLVSRQHCEIRESEGQLVVRDLGSLNGTFVANERVNEAVLANGQLLTVGTVTFRAVYLEEDAQPPASGEPMDVAPETVQTEETVTAPQAQPAPEADSTQAVVPQAEAPEAGIPQAEIPQATPPMADPVPADDGGDEDDDLSSFFDSLK